MLLPQIKTLKYAYSKIKDGNMSEFFGEKNEAKKNIKKFFESNNFQRNEKYIIEMDVEHRDKIVKIERVRRDSSQSCDALITNSRKYILLLKPADCLPLIFFDKKHSVLALVHLGWKSTNIGLAKKVVRVLRNEYNSDIANIIAILGPCIRKESAIYKDIDGRRKILFKWGGFFKDIDRDRFQIDIPGYVKYQLLQNKIKNENIFDCMVDTVKSKEYFSHYRDISEGQKDKGRFLCAATITNVKE